MNKRQMAFQHHDMPGLVEITPFYVEDERGYFLKDYEQEVYERNGIDFAIAEEFESSSRKGVLRGLHFQDVMPQGKLVRAVQGEIFDVAVDLRKKSPTYGQWRSVILDSGKRNTLLVPPGCAHGYLVLSEIAIVHYKCAGRFLSAHDTGIVWNDPDIGIQWPLQLAGELIISGRDRALQCFRDFASRVSDDPVFAG